jgi:hypothetical protein
MMKFPYGLSDFYKVITQGYFYVDRTSYIRLIEETGDQLLLLRPRRFGKSMLLSMLENYYDVNKADEFDRLFGKLEIGKNPTPLHNQYLVMRWDFSAVRTYGSVEDVARALNDYINIRIDNFVSRYEHLLSRKVTIYPDNAAISFESALTAIQRTPYKLYLLIDEYDNFANEVLMAGGNVGRQRYQELVEGEGVFRSIFKTIKSATGGLGLDRFFIVGVSPVVLSDVSSGFNISVNIYLWPNFNEICGFTEPEIENALLAVGQQCGMTAEKMQEALTLLRAFYNGYSFSYNLPPTVYNSTLVLYFLRYLQTFCTYPTEIFDSNLAMAQTKITYISQLPNGEQMLLAALQEDPLLALQEVEEHFGVERMLAAEHGTGFMASLLYYFGVLTLTAVRTSDGKSILRIPNQVARKLYAERICELLLPDVATRKEGSTAADILCHQGDPQPLCDFIEQRYFRVLDNRDYRWANELTVKTAFLTLLFDNSRYMMDSEPALQRNYGDLLMLIRPEMRKYQLFDILFEFEYVTLTEAGVDGESARTLPSVDVSALPAVKKKVDEARRQLQNYKQLLHANHGAQLKLRCYAVVALGFDRLVWEEVV